MTTNNQQGMTDETIREIAGELYTEHETTLVSDGVTFKQCEEIYPQVASRYLEDVELVLSLISQHSASQEAEIKRLKGKLGKTEYNYEMLIEEHGKLKADSQSLIEEFVTTHDKYIELLVAELNEVCLIAHNHGWRSDRYEAGKQCREEIESLKKRVRGDGT